MRNLNLFDAYRDASPQVIAFYGDAGDHSCGVFHVPFPRTGVTLKIVASVGVGWDHISVSLPNRCPNWPEMEHIKRMFFREDETAMQLHVPPSDHLSLHPYCLHLWRPLGQEIPRPPAELVGTAGLAA